jgi:hypothetical protein
MKRRSWPSFAAGCFIRSSEEMRSPDIQIHCLPAYVVDHGRMRIKGHELPSTRATCAHVAEGRSNCTLLIP